MQLNFNNSIDIVWLTSRPALDQLRDILYVFILVSLLLAGGAAIISEARKSKNRKLIRKLVPLPEDTPTTGGANELQVSITPQNLYALVIGINIYASSPPEPSTPTTFLQRAGHWIAQTFGTWVFTESIESPESPMSSEVESIEPRDFIEPHTLLKRLHGAVNDANEVTKFLEGLGVPATHIVNLRDENATRSRIIQEIEALSKKPEINKDDPILIYYAGHGGLAMANGQWAAKYGSKEIQVIFPYDYDQPKKAYSTERVNCIPDRTIAGLLNELSSRKGDNITVIFDSCHSASANRGRSTRLERVSSVKLDIPPEIDNDLFTSDDQQQRGAALPLCTDQTSHVFLAACGSHQGAGEANGRGFFTDELLKNLPPNGLDCITYHDLMKSLKVSGQSPECYGKHKNRFLFNARITRDRSFIDVHFDDENAMILEAGAVSGVTEKSIWELHQAPKRDSESFGRFKVAELRDSTAVLEPLGPKRSAPNLDSRRRFARRIVLGLEEDQVLKVWMSPEDTRFLFPGSVQYTGSTNEGGISYRMSKTRDGADIAVELLRPPSAQKSVDPDQAEAVFYWYDNATRKHKTEKLPYQKRAVRQEVEVVLFAAAKWKWHLERINPDADPRITMSMLKVATRKNTRARREYLEKHEDMPVGGDGIVEIREENSPMALYGFKLKSNTHSPLYVRMFYFDTTDFSIGDMFGHRAGPSDIGTDISSMGELLVGNGSEGGVPIRLVVSSKKPKEIGYMKVFWSTQPLGLDELEQKSAFELRSGDVRGASHDSLGPGEWGTECLAVVVQKEVRPLV